MKNQNTAILFPLAFLVTLIGCAKEDGLEDKRVNDGLFIDGKKIITKSSRLYRGSDTLVLTLQANDSQSMQFRLLTQNGQDQYDLGDGSKNVIQYLPRNGQPIYSTEWNAETTTLRLEELNVVDSILRLSGELVLHNSLDHSRTVTIKIDSDHVIPYSNSSTNGFESFWIFESLNLGNPASGQFPKKISHSGGEIIFTIKTNIKESLKVHFPEYIASGNYNLKDGRNAVGLLEFQSATSFPLHSAMEGEYSLVHDQLNRYYEFESDSVTLVNNVQDTIVAKEIYFKLSY